jgi:antitoxin component YwqK of YwqJK toxin-antitoxin module
MKTIPFFTTIFLFFIQILSCTNIFESREVEVKFNIQDQYSKNPKYELIFSSGGEEIARRIFEKGKTILEEGEIPDGQVIEKYDSGNIRNIFSYKKGKRNGKAFSFYENGRLKKEGIYLEDNPIGITKMYYENGNLKVESKIKDGKNLYYKEYYENGQMKQEVYYKGDEIKRKMYDINGQILKD